MRCLPEAWCLHSLPLLSTRAYVLLSFDSARFPPQLSSGEWSQCITMETQSNSTVVGEAQPNPLFDLLNSYAALRLTLPLPALLFVVVAGD